MAGTIPRRWLSSLVTLSWAMACAGEARPLQAPTPAPRRDAGAVPTPDATPRALAPPPSAREGAVLWGNIRTTEECFFFSGPLELGRDARLGDQAGIEGRGDALVLSMGEARFLGSELGDQLSVERVQNHRHEGEWSVTERIEARWEQGELRGHYRYEECDLTGTQGCPTRCTIDADFSIAGLTRASP